MKTFVNIVLPALWFAALFGAFAWELRRMRKARKHRREPVRCPMPLRTRMAYPFRLGWYKRTGRMPGKCPKRDPFRLTERDRAKFGGIAIGLAEDEPQRERRRP